MSSGEVATPIPVSNEPTKTKDERKKEKLSQLDKEADCVLTRLKEERAQRREVIKTLDEQLSQINQVVYVVANSDLFLFEMADCFSYYPDIRMFICHVHFLDRAVRSNSSDLDLPQDFQLSFNIEILKLKSLTYLKFRNKKKKKKKKN